MNFQINAESINSFGLADIFIIDAIGVKYRIRSLDLSLFVDFCRRKYNKMKKFISKVLFINI